MDDFSKTFLQLSFPMYLILIAFLLNIGSRYSINLMQRFTAQRAFPVLATLFILVYTKILLMVCSVLFLYPVAHLPEGHITFVWSVDTGDPLFGFIIVCFLPYIISTLASI